MLRERGFYRGIDLGGWLSQCDYSEDRLDHFITEPDFAKIASWGLDHVRTVRGISRADFRGSTGRSVWRKSTA